MFLKSSTNLKPHYFFRSVKMGKGNMTSCCYYLMYVFTFLFLLCGCAVLGVGLFLRFNIDARTIFDALKGYYASSEKPTYEEHAEIANAVGSQFYFYFCYALMLIGGLVMLVGFVGCCGTIYESSCILCFFSFLLMLLLTAQFGASVLGYWQLTQPDDHNVVQSWVETDMKYLVDNYDQYAQAVDTIQQRLKCCGANSFNDYNDTPPSSCTDSYNGESNSVGMSAGMISGVRYYDEGCSRAFMDFLKERVLAGLVVIFCVAVFEFIGILFACCLCCGIRSQSDYSTA